MNSIIVNYSLTLEEMIALRSYDWMDKTIDSQRFQIAGNGMIEFECELFNFNRRISSTHALKTIWNADGVNRWMPAKIEHLLYFGAAKSHFSSNQQFVALGSVIEMNGGCFAPNICVCSASDPDLVLDNFKHKWSDRSCFIAVRPVMKRLMA